ncbi:hypothetical protein WA158_008358 [Blastocystis sp. Blastoise]
MQVEDDQKESEHVKRRCVISRSNGDYEEVVIDLQDKDELFKLFNAELEYIGEMEGSQIAVLSYSGDNLPENPLHMAIDPPQDKFFGDLLLFKVGINGEPIDLSITMFKRALKRNHKSRNATEDEKNNEEKQKEEKSKEIKSTLSTGSPKGEVYIDGLPYETQEADIQEFFKELKSHIIQVKMPRYQDSGRCRGYCHVVFDDESCITEALKKDHEYMGKRYVRVQRANGVVPVVQNKSSITSVPANCDTVFVKNIPYEYDEEQIRNAFMLYGPIVNVRIPRWTQTGRTKGIAYIQYKRGDSVLNAVKKSGTLELEGRYTTVDFETGKPKASFKDQDGKFFYKSKENKKRVAPSPSVPVTKASDKKIKL